MSRRTYTDETRAAVLSALMQGQTVSAVAKKYDIPPGTVKSWRSHNLNSKAENSVATQKKQALGDMIMGLLEQELITLQAIARHASNEDWLREQTASETAVLFGVIQDKVFRKIEALNKNVRPSDD